MKPSKFFLLILVSFFVVVQSVAAQTTNTILPNDPDPGFKDPEPVVDISKLVEYPMAALKANIEGKVMVSGLVGLNGGVKAVEVYEPSGYGCLDTAALEAMKKALFTPGTKEYKKAELWITQPVTFQLYDTAHHPISYAAIPKGYPTPIKLRSPAITDTITHHVDVVMNINDKGQAVGMYLKPDQSPEVFEAIKKEVVKYTYKPAIDGKGKSMDGLLVVEVEVRKK